ncbi:MAG: hypothetical protein ACI8RD_010036 [Bacillariaceae sp.]|jgi:hypothetical protein
MTLDIVVNKAILERLLLSLPLHFEEEEEEDKIAYSCIVFIQKENR